MIRILFYLLVVILPFTGMGCGCSKKENHEEEHHEEAVHLKEESQEMVGLEFFTVKKAPLISLIQVSGEIAQETEHVNHITPPQSGTLKTFKVNIGEVVDEGALLCIVTTKDGSALEIKSPSHGIVMAKYLKEGDSVDTVSSILTIANPDLLRAGFNVYEKDIAGIQMGQKVILESLAYPEKKFEGEITFISPQVDSETRSIKVRVDVKNGEHLLKFGMFVTGKIMVPLAGEGIVIPESAVQKIKEQPSVFVPEADEPDEFLIRAVKVGRKIDEQVEILEGLSEGETIVTKGSFYLKSELLKGELEEGHAH